MNKWMDELIAIWFGDNGEKVKLLKIKQKNSFDFCVAKFLMFHFFTFFVAPKKRSMSSVEVDVSSAQCIDSWTAVYSSPIDINVDEFPR